MLLKKILPLIPKHDTYIEVFGGGASLLFAKEPSNIEVYNDVNDGLVNFFRVLRDPDKFGRFYHYAINTMYARSEYDDCLRTWQNETDEVIKAYKWFVVARMSFSGKFGEGWSNSVSTAGPNGISRACAGWLAILDILPDIHKRMRIVQIECRDWRTILDRYNNKNIFAYLDPPYVPETRLGGGYQHEMTTEDHIDLVNVLLNYKGMAMLSGYINDIYKPLEEAGWVRKDFETTCHVGLTEEKPARVESVWLNQSAFKIEVKDEGFDFECKEDEEN